MRTFRREEFDSGAFVLEISYRRGIVEESSTILRRLFPLVMKILPVFFVEWFVKCDIVVSYNQ